MTEDQIYEEIRRRKQQQIASSSFHLAVVLASCLVFLALVIITK